MENSLKARPRVTSLFLDVVVVPWWQKIKKKKKLEKKKQVSGSGSSSLFHSPFIVYAIRWEGGKKVDKENEEMEIYSNDRAGKKKVDGWAKLIERKNKVRQPFELWSASQVDDS